MNIYIQWSPLVTFHRPWSFAGGIYIQYRLLN